MKNYINMKRTSVQKNTTSPDLLGNTDEQIKREFHPFEILYKDCIVDPKDIQEVKNLNWMKIGLFLIVAMTTFSLFANEKESKRISFYIGASAINRESNQNVINTIQPAISLGVTIKIIKNLQL